MPGPGGDPDFRGLQGRGRRARFFVFDLLRRDEDDLTDVPLTQRKHLLISLVGRDLPSAGPGVRGWRQAPRSRRAARPRRHRLEAQGVTLPLWPAPRLGEDQDVAWRAANRKRWQIFANVSPKQPRLPRSQ